MATIPSIGQAATLGANALTSIWDGLSPHLIATFYEVAKTILIHWEMSSSRNL